MISRSPANVRSRLDFWQAASGACLALFILVHLILEGSVVLSPSITNAIGWFLEATYAAQIAAPLIVALIVFHFWIAARKFPLRSGGLGFLLITPKLSKIRTLGCGLCRWQQPSLY